MDRTLVLLVTAIVTGCDDHVIAATAPVGAEGFCGVQIVAERSCANAGCHGASSAAGGLDLETDPYGALVDGSSAVYDLAYVVPGDPEASFVYQKITGTQGAAGAQMPIGAPLSATDIELVSQWIEDGAPDCEER